MKLSENFWLSEFLRSNTAARMGRKVEADEAIVDNLRNLCVNVLQPARDALTTIHPGIRLIVTSGYRPQWLNKAVGGAMNSDHMRGCAADVILSGEPEGFELLDAAQAIRDAGVKFDQLILEGGEWLHLSWRPIPRQETLTARFGERTTYERGLA